MAFTRDYVITTPIDHTLNANWPTYDRNTKQDVQDRLKDIISGFNSGETVKGVLNLPFIAQSTPSPITDQSQMYGKADSGKTRMAMMDEDGNETFIMPCRSGDVLFSSSVTIPPGFTDISTTYAGKNVRISGTALTTAGSDTLSGTTGSTTLTANQSALVAHTHTVLAYHNGSGSGVSDGQSTNGTPQATSSTGGNDAIEGHTHPLTGISCVNAYVTLKAYQKS